MRNSNNLTNEHACAFFRVTKPFTVLVKAGNYPSNTYVGASQMYGNLYRVALLPVGTEVHDLFGGVFVVLNGERHEARTALSERHPFEKTYGLGETEKWPVEKLARMPKAEASNPPIAKVPTVAAPATGYHGRGIDAVLDL